MRRSAPTSAASAAAKALTTKAAAKPTTCWPCSHDARCRCGNLPVALAGFSFGAYAQTRVARRLSEAGHPAQRLVLVGTAAGFVEGTRQYDTEAVPHDTIVIHGSADETVPLANVLDWARPLDLPVVVVPGADHFFHRRLHLIRDIITRAWRH